MVITDGCYFVLNREPDGKERKSIYIALFWPRWYTQSAQAWITQFYLQITPRLPFLLSVHQMSPPQQLRQRTSNCSPLLIYRPRKDERLSWPSWLTCSRWFAHISGHPSATGRAQDSETTPAKDQCSTDGTVKRDVSSVVKAYVHRVDKKSTAVKSTIESVGPYKILGSRYAMVGNPSSC